MRTAHEVLPLRYKPRNASARPFAAPCLPLCQSNGGVVKFARLFAGVDGIAVDLGLRACSRHGSQCSTANFYLVHTDKCNVSAPKLRPAATTSTSRSHTSTTRRAARSCAPDRARQQERFKATLTYSLTPMYDEKPEPYALV